MMGRKCILVALVLLCHGNHARGAALYSVKHNDTHYGSTINNNSSASSSYLQSVGVSLNVAIPYSEQTMYSEEKKANLPQKQQEQEEEKQAKRHDTPPGKDTDPDGIIVYNSLDQVPTARMLWLSHKRQTCYASTDRTSQCWAAYVCGHRCEPILLAINSFCRRKETNYQWIRCQKARKFSRCFARICFRTSTGRSASKNRPVPYEDPFSVSIVRYHRPVRKHSAFLWEWWMNWIHSGIYFQHLVQICISICTFLLK